MIFFNYLSFSDAAKCADVARNLVEHGVYGSLFSFGGGAVQNEIVKTFFGAEGILPLTPFSIALFFKMFGVSDHSVVAVSMVYFVMLVIFTFLLGRKLFGDLTGILSAAVVAASPDFLNYATNGSTEAPFAFEIVAAMYFVTKRKGWATIVSVVFMVLMYFTRPQAFIYIAGLVLYWLSLNFKPKKALTIFLAVLGAGFLFDYFVLPKFAGNYFLYSVTQRGIGTATQVVAGGPVSDSLRGGAAIGTGFLGVVKKLFYDLYNFYKLMPQIVNPYLFVLFVLGLFKWGKGRLDNSFKVAVVFMAATTFLVAAASIPFFRYIHPVIPLVYVIATATLVFVVGKITDNRKYLVLVTSFLILFFAVGQTVGILLLDTRYEKRTHNIGKPPVYAELSYRLRDSTRNNDTVLTNLDTWGTWYGERRTVWFPLTPGRIIDPATGKIPFDAIYLTSYLIDDQNYYMGTDWRQVFENPTDSRKWVCEGCAEIAKEFRLKEVFIISPDEDFERQSASGVLLVKK